MSKSINILDIGPNDDLTEVIRKCNYNFRQYLNAQGSDEVSLLSAQDDIDDVRESLAEQIDNVINMINNISGVQDDQLDAIKKDMQDIKKKSAPPIGTYMYSLNDPSEQWDWTEWEEIEKDLYISSVEKESSSVEKLHGKNEYKLNEYQVPDHVHKLNGMTYEIEKPYINSGLDSEFIENTFGPFYVTVDPIISKKKWEDVPYTYPAYNNGNYRMYSYSNSSETKDVKRIYEQDSIDNRPKSICIPLWKRIS